MADRAVDLPKPHPDDDEDVVDWLSTARALWARGERADALVWLRRAADAASSASQPFRASEIGMYVTALEEKFGDIPGQTPIPGGEQTAPYGGSVTAEVAVNVGGFGPPASASRVAEGADRVPQDTLVDSTEAFGALASEVLRSRMASIEVDMDDDTLIEDEPPMLAANTQPALDLATKAPPPPPPRTPSPGDVSVREPKVIVQAAAKSVPAPPMPVARAKTGKPPAPLAPPAAFVPPLAAPRNPEGEEITLVSVNLRDAVRRPPSAPAPPPTPPFVSPLATTPSPGAVRLPQSGTPPPPAGFGGSPLTVPRPPPTPTSDSFEFRPQRETPHVAKPLNPSSEAPPPPLSSRPEPLVSGAPGSAPPPRPPLPSVTGTSQAPGPRRVVLRSSQRAPREPILDPWAEEELAAAPRPLRPVPKSGPEEVVVFRARLPSMHDEDEVFTSAAPLPVSMRRAPKGVAGPPSPPPAPPVSVQGAVLLNPASPPPAPPPAPPPPPARPGRLITAVDVAPKELRLSSSAGVSHDETPPRTASSAALSAQTLESAVRPVAPRVTPGGATARIPSRVSTAKLAENALPSGGQPASEKADSDEGAITGPAVEKVEKVAVEKVEKVEKAAVEKVEKAAVDKARGHRAPPSVPPPPLDRIKSQRPSAPLSVPPLSTRRIPTVPPAPPPAVAPASAAPFAAPSSPPPPAPAPPVASRSAAPSWPPPPIAPPPVASRSAAPSWPPPPIAPSTASPSATAPSSRPVATAATPPNPSSLKAPSVLPPRPNSTAPRPKSGAPSEAMPSSVPAPPGPSAPPTSSLPSTISIPSAPTISQSSTFDPNRATLPMMLEIEPPDRQVEMGSMRPTLPMPMELPKEIEAMFAAAEQESILLEGARLDQVDAFEGMPANALSHLASSARVVELGPDEEAGGFGGALLLTGEAVLCATIVDAAAHWPKLGELLVTHGGLTDGVAMRVVGAGKGGTVALWNQSHLDEAFSFHAPGISRALSRGDRLQALAGATMGPFGEIEDEHRQKLVDELSVVALKPGQIWIEDGAPAPAITIVGAGEVELYGPISEETSETVEPGCLVFPELLVCGGEASSCVRAGASGALLLVADREVAARMSIWVPDLAERLRAG